MELSIALPFIFSFEDRILRLPHFSLSVQSVKVKHQPLDNASFVFIRRLHLITMKIASLSFAVPLCSLASSLFRTERHCFVSQLRRNFHEKRFESSAKIPHRTRGNREEQSLIPPRHCTKAKFSFSGFREKHFAQNRKLISETRKNADSRRLSDRPLSDLFWLLTFFELRDVFLMRHFPLLEALENCNRNNQ